jgi:hypothetical protein
LRSLRGFGKNHATAGEVLHAEWAVSEDLQGAGDRVGSGAGRGELRLRAGSAHFMTRCAIKRPVRGTRPSRANQEKRHGLSLFGCVPSALSAKLATYSPSLTG